MESKKNKKQKYKDLTGRSVEELCNALNISPDFLIQHQQEEYKRRTPDAKHTQNWKEYNKAQTKEKLLFYKLLDELMNVVPERTYNFGRPRKSLRDMTFCCMIKTYYNTSARGIISDLKLAHHDGYISNIPHFNTILNYLKDKEVLSIMKDLKEKIQKSTSSL